MSAVVSIVVAVLNAVGPGIIDLVRQAMSHPSLDDNGKAAVAALGVELPTDEKAVDAVPPLDVPNPKPTAR